MMLYVFLFSHLFMTMAYFLNKRPLFCWKFKLKTLKLKILLQKMLVNFIFKDFKGKCLGKKTIYFNAKLRYG